VVDRDTGADRVHVLHHVRKEDEYADYPKLIGVYRSRAAAELAIERLKDRPGFKDHPAGFQVSAYELDKDHWEEGFISWDEANADFPDP